MAAETAQFDEEALRALLAARPDWSRELGGSPSEWRVREVGDGNVNFVFEAAGPRGRLCVKHAAPFIRVVRQFALSPQRIRFEARAAEEAARAAPARVPRVVGFDAERGVLCLEWLSPHVVLRRALMAGTRLPLLAEHLGTFLARTLFRTSDLALRAEAKRRLAQEFAENAPMCRLTEDAVFTDALSAAPVFPNRHTAPFLDEAAAELRRDAALKARVAELKQLFLCAGEALVHGDLHTGSVMATADDTRVIDGEFAFVGPLAFDPGLLVANLLIALLAAPRRALPDAAGFCRHMLETLRALWAHFVRDFAAQWADAAAHAGDGFPARLLSEADGSLQLAQSRFFARVWAQTAGFAGCEMLRRVLGVAHVEDLETIAEPRERAAAELAVLRLARWMVCEAGDLEAVLARAAALCEGSAPLGMPPCAEAASARCLVLVSKLPAAGASKTRLAREIGEARALAFAEASLRDLLARFGGCASHASTLLFAPPEAAAPFAALLREEGVEARWRLEPMAAGDLAASDLGARLAAALRSARSRGHAHVAFVGSDCPHLPAATVADAFAACERGRAFVAPATDGGYVCVGVPERAPLAVFERVRWSAADTCLSQLQRLSAEGVACEVGATASDVDVAADLAALRAALAGEADAAFCRHTRRFLAS